MKKYFLLATVALFAATNANAAAVRPTGPYTHAVQNKANLNLKAKLQFASEYNCTDLDFGTITLNSNEDLSDVTITLAANGTAPTTDNTVLEVKDPEVAVCGGADANNGNDVFTAVTTADGGNTITLTNTADSTKTATVELDVDAANYKVGGSINFKIEDQSYESLKKWAGDYTATATFTTIFN